jgi:hypothetical protein
MYGSGQFGVPGVSAGQFNVTKNIFWGGDESKLEILRYDAKISSTAADAGASPTTTLRGGLLLGKLASSGELVAWNPNTDDGSEILHSVLEIEQHMTDSFGTAVDRFCPVVVKAPLKASELLIEGTVLTSSADQYLARRQLHAMGCRLSDDPQGYLAGAHRRMSTKITNYTVVAADNGTLFIAKTADATFTLPAIAAGLSFEFMRLDDFELVVASAEGDNMIVGNDASADSITFTTAGQQIGARIKITGEYIDGTLKWVPELPYTPFGTGLATLAFALGT